MLEYLYNTIRQPATYKISRQLIITIVKTSRLAKDNPFIVYGQHQKQTSGAQPTS